MDRGNSKATWHDTLVRLRWPLAVVAVCLIAFLAFLAGLWITKRTFNESVTRAGQAGRALARKAVTIAEKFKQGTITRTFQAAIPHIVTTGSGNLELATATQTESFRAEDNKAIFWNTIPLGKTVSEIRVPVTYRYHLRLADPWLIEVSGQTCVVTAPQIRPSLPPAIHTDRMEKHSEAGWARFNAQMQMEELEKEMTPALNGYALSPDHLSLVREQARKTVAEFVKTWLLKEDHWRQDRFHTIKVIFADEPSAKPELLPPTVELR